MKISVCVICYNQELFIEDCLNGIIKQDFPYSFEVIIRDDCSTDKTKAIILECIRKNSNPLITFKVLDSFENLGPNKNLKAVMSEAVGEFLAFCEGDDYWCDLKKLKKQYLQANENPNCDFFVHPAYYHNNTDELIKAEWPINFPDKQFTKSIFEVPWQFAPTSSYFIKRASLSKLPSWFESASIADIYLEFYASLNGIAVIHEYMSVYRFEALGSWSRKMKDKNNFMAIDKSIRHYVSFNFCLNKIANDYPEYKDSINVKLSNNYIQLALLYLDKKESDKFKQSMEMWHLLSNSKVWYRKLLYLFRGSMPLSNIIYKAKRYIS